MWLKTCNGMMEEKTNTTNCKIGSAVYAHILTSFRIFPTRDIHLSLRHTHRANAIFKTLRLYPSTRSQFEPPWPSRGHRAGSHLLSSQSSGNGLKELSRWRTDVCLSSGQDLLPHWLEQSVSPLLPN